MTLIESKGGARFCQEAEISLNAAATEIENDSLKAGGSSATVAQAIAFATQLRGLAAIAGRVGIAVQPITRKD